MRQTARTCNHIHVKKEKMNDQKHYKLRLLVNIYGPVTSSCHIPGSPCKSRLGPCQGCKGINIQIQNSITLFSVEQKSFKQKYSLTLKYSPPSLLLVTQSWPTCAVCFPIWHCFSLFTKQNY